MATELAQAYVQIIPSAKGISGKLSQIMDGEADSAGKSSGNKFSQAFGGMLKGLGVMASSAVGAAAAGVASLTKAAVSSYSDYEQLAGGTELLFGRTAEETEALKQSMLDIGMSARQVEEEMLNMSDASDLVMQNAQTAFSRVQMSMNDYLQQANSYATGLKESLGGDAEEAAKLTDKIITAQADIVAATGNNAENVANAFAGIMKNNFTMLDNLQLGIKPTKEGMQEVIDKMNELNGTEYKMGNLADMQAAIVDYVDYVGMAGYAQNEAADTIQGSLASTKAAWENLMTALGTGDTDMISTSINNLVETATQLGSNIMPIIQSALGGMSQLIQQLGPEIASAIPELITQVLPGLLAAGVEIIDSLGSGILSAVPQLLPTVTSLVLDLAKMILSGLPQLLNVGFQIINELAGSISSALPTLIPLAAETLVQLIDGILSNIPMLLEAGVQILIGLNDGILQALPILIDSLPTIITGIINALLTGLPILIQGAIQLVNGLVQAMPQIIPALIEAAPQILTGIIGALVSNAPMLVDAFIQLFGAVGSAWGDISMMLIQSIPQSFVEIANAFMALGPILVDTFNQIMTMVGPTFSQLGVEAQTAWAAIQSAFANVGEWFRQKFTAASNGVKTAFNNVKSFFQNLWMSIQQVFSDAVSKFTSIGSNIANGILKGLSSSWENLKAFLQKACGDLIALAKRILGIASPSKEFASQVGQWIPAGIAQGIQNGMGVLNKEIRSMTDNMLVGSIKTSTEAVSSVNFVPDMSSKAAGGSVVINNNIRVDGAQDPEAWTQTFFKTLEREARMA